MQTKKKMTGYPSIDKPWLKYYSAGAINAPLPECTIYEYLWESNKDHLDDTALDFIGTKITYGELFRRIKQVAACYQQLGVTQKDTVALMMLNSPEAVVSLYALNYLGAVADFIYFKKDIEAIVGDIAKTGAKLFVVQELPDMDYSTIIQKSNIEKCVLVPLSTSMPAPVRMIANLKNKRSAAEHPKIVRWSSFLQMGKQDVGYCASDSNQTAVIAHTGGTTGSPKGVMLSNNNLNACVHQTKLADMGWKRRERVVHTIPPFVAYGITIGVHMTLCHGMHCIMIPDPSPTQMGELVHKYRPYAIVGGPPHVESMISYRKMKKEDLCNLNILIVGGESLSLEREKQANEYLKQMNAKARIQTGYGMTETCSAVCVNMDKGRRRVGSLGIPFSHTVIAAFDPETGEEVQYGMDGEICISSPNNMLGYLNNVSATKELVREHNDRAWVHTGDIGKIDRDGFVYITGRIKRIYMVREQTDGGLFKLFPVHIEDTITEIPGVVNSCVVCRKDEERYHVPIAYVELSSAELASQEMEKTIHTHCVQQLPTYCVPEEIIFIDNIPLTVVGKKDYRALEKEVNKE